VKLEQEKQCSAKLIWSFQQLGYELPQTEVEMITKLLVQTMTDTWRYFHTLDHILMVGNSDYPLEILASLFHDWIYVQVDGKINFNLGYYLTPFIEEDFPNHYKIKEESQLPQDLTFEVVLAIFGLTKGQELITYLGQNEFLSALAAAKILEPFLPLSIIAQIVTIIEATIPFRSKSEDGFTPSEVLYQRLKLTNNQFNLGLSLGEIEDTIKQSVRLSNRDVSSFGADNSAEFLDNTWKLLPETNHNLTNTNSFTIRDYRIAIQKMEGFVYSLEPDLIFSQFNNYPSPDDYANIVIKVRNNLTIGKLYLTCKLIAISFLEAICLRLGEQLIFRVVMGNLITQNNPRTKLAYFLPSSEQSNPEFNTLSPEYQETLRILKEEKYDCIDCDSQESYLAYFLVCQLGFKRMLNLRTQTLDFANNKLSGEDFIACFPPKTVKIFTDYLVQLFTENIKALSC
jgi:hypothetical protein